MMVAIEEFLETFGLHLPDRVKRAFGQDKAPDLLPAVFHDALIERLYRNQR